MKVSEIKKGDIVTYRSGRVNHVNNPGNYHYWYNDDFKNRQFGSAFEIMTIQRYIKFLFFYRLVTIYKRSN